MARMVRMVEMAKMVGRGGRGEGIDIVVTLFILYYYEYSGDDYQNRSQS